MSAEILQGLLLPFAGTTAWCRICIRTRKVRGHGGRHRLCGPEERERGSAAMADIPQDFDGKLLEVPVGTGVLTMPLYRALPRAENACLDDSEAMMANAARRAEALSVKNVSFTRGDVGHERVTVPAPTQKGLRLTGGRSSPKPT